MDRTDTIDRIAQRLGTVDDVTLDLIFDLVEDPLDSRPAVRDLTPEELAEVECSKADFAAGRSMSLDELTAFLDSAAAVRRSARGA